VSHGFYCFYLYVLFGIMAIKPKNKGFSI
jgi:hypothetical protein